MESGKPKTQRFAEIEGLRGLAAVMVVVHHFILTFYSYIIFGPTKGAKIHMRWEELLFNNPIMGLVSGKFAVSIFFVLSGFVLSIGYFVTREQKTVERLALKRYPRLMIPAAVSLIICYVLIQFGLSNTLQVAAITKSSWLHTGWDTNPVLLQVLGNGFYGIFFFGQSPYNNVLWTMTTEFIGSFIVFGSLIFFTKSNYRYLAYVVMLLFSINYWFFGFIFGMILADLYASGAIKETKRSLVILLPLVLASVYLAGFPFAPEMLGSYYLFFNNLSFLSLNLSILMPEIAAIIVLYLVLTTGWIKNLLGLRAIKALGEYTFSLYLIHLPIIYTFTTGAFLYFNQSYSYNKSVIFSVALTIPLLMAATFVFQKLVDEKSIKVAGKLAALYSYKDR